MSAKSKVCRKKEIIASKRKVGESPRMEKSRWVVRIVGRKGKQRVRATANLEKSKMYRAVSGVSQRGHIDRGTQESTPFRLRQSDSNKNPLRVPALLKGREPGDGGLLTFSKRIVVV